MGQSKADIVSDLKVAMGCMDCGFSGHPSALEFDHLPDTDKVDNLSTLVRTGTWREIFLEMSKCDLVCANCHRVRTSGRPYVRKVTVKDTPTVIGNFKEAKSQALAYLKSHPQTSATELAKMFDRTDRWGRLVREEFALSDSNKRIVDAYVARGVCPNRAQVRDEYKVGAARADAILKAVRVTINGT